MSDRLHDRFVRLCEIRSPTGSERAVADTVAAELRGARAPRSPRTTPRGRREPAPATCSRGSRAGTRGG